MNKRPIGILAAAVILIGAYAVLSRHTSTENEPAPSSSTTYTNADLGIAFAYPAGPNGYVLQESTSTDPSASLVRTITLMRSADAAQMMPVGGEGPPTITIQVFKNTTKQWPQTWADEHPQQSNINLKTGEVAEVVVGGANAIRYKADGLYASENVIVAHGENVYVLHGMYLDENSALRQDFTPLVASIRFIPQPGQE